MNDIQNKKNETKFNLLEEHILDLIEYNNLKNYDNIKKFTVKINYFKELNGYNYDINILRGTHYPQKTLSLRFNSKEKINDLIKNLILKLLNNDYLLYTSFGKNYDFIDKYVLNFKNDVKVEFSINDNQDKLFYESINKLHKNNIIIKDIDKFLLNDLMKDELQKNKAIKVINSIDNLFDSIIRINNINNYENKKPYKLLIKSSYSKDRTCYFYSFNIIRGDINPEIVVEYSLSINDNDIVLEELNKLLSKYINSNDILYKDSYNAFLEEHYELSMNNQIKIKIETNIDKDIEYFNKIMNDSILVKSLHN